jgi:hypothetical protein
MIREQFVDSPKPELAEPWGEEMGVNIDEWCSRQYLLDSV